ncbi:MAG: hypothetical protein KDE55_11205 [Novosphingobium sp.]|nr:hypothetical protein [Novosphingobium sp.]
MGSSNRLLLNPSTHSGVAYSTASNNRHCPRGRMMPASVMRSWEVDGAIGQIGEYASALASVDPGLFTDSGSECAKQPIIAAMDLNADQRDGCSPS